MIQDTSFVIDILRGVDEAHEMLDILERESRPEKVAAITVLELHEGLAQQDTPAVDRVLEVLRSKHIIPGDEAIMRKAGSMSGELINDGREIDREDCIIAATALLADEPVITRDIDHFERIDGVTVRSY